jgi:hypothetical protein
VQRVARDFSRETTPRGGAHCLKGQPSRRNRREIKVGATFVPRAASRVARCGRVMSLVSAAPRSRKLRCASSRGNGRARCENGGLIRTPIELRDRLIEEGLESIGKDHDLQEHEREGSRLGFEMCRYLETLWEYEELLATRQRIEIRMATQDSDMEAYWRHRYASLQVQFIYDHLKVVLPTPPGTLHSVNAIMHVHRILRAD